MCVLWWLDIPVKKEDGNPDNTEVVDNSVRHFAAGILWIVDCLNIWCNFGISFVVHDEACSTTLNSANTIGMLFGCFVSEC